MYVRTCMCVRACECACYLPQTFWDVCLGAILSFTLFLSDSIYPCKPGLSSPWTTYYNKMKSMEGEFLLSEMLGTGSI